MASETAFGHWNPRQWGKDFFLVPLCQISKLIFSEISTKFLTTWPQRIFSNYCSQDHCDPCFCPNIRHQTLGTFTSLYLFSILMQLKYLFNSQSNSGQVTLVSALINGSKYCKMKRLQKRVRSLVIVILLHFRWMLINCKVGLAERVLESPFADKTLLPTNLPGRRDIHSAQIGF